MEITASEDLTAKGRAIAEEVRMVPGKYGTSTTVKARDPLPALKLLAERREKEKQAKQEQGDGPRHLGTIFYFERRPAKATIETEPNDSNDRTTKPTEHS